MKIEIGEDYVSFEPENTAEEFQLDGLYLKAAARKVPVYKWGWGLATVNRGGFEGGIGIRFPKANQ